MRPLVAVEGDTGAFRRAWRDLTREGWKVQPGWAENPPADDATDAPVVRAVSVGDRVSAGRAVLTARVGNGLLVHAQAPRDVLDLLYQDLEHLGSLVIRTNRDPVPSRVLPPEQQRLLRLLLDGTTLSEAAAALSISRRTADRRVAAARRFFNVGTTAELLRAARHELP